MGVIPLRKDEEKEDLQLRLELPRSLIVARNRIELAKIGEVDAICDGEHLKLHAHPSDGDIIWARAAYRVYSVELGGKDIYGALYRTFVLPAQWEITDVIPKDKQ